MYELDDYALSIWAKTDPYHPLLYHMIDVGNVALCLLSTKTFHAIEDKFINATGIPPNGCKSWLAYLAALHDIGKCDPDFQVKGGEELIRPLKDFHLPFRTMEAPKFRHEIRSYEFIKNYLESEHGWGKMPRVTVAYCILGHHSNFQTGDLDHFDQWENLRKAMAASMKNVFKPEAWSPDNFKDYSTAGMLLTGLIVLSDWIASNTDLMPVNHNVSDEVDYARISMAQAKKAVVNIGFDDQVTWSTGAKFHDVWTGFNPRPVQEVCENIAAQGSMPKLAIIEAPMGDGKTEAAIYLATQYMSNLSLNGLYIALPTAATSNQMHGRVVKLLNDHHYADKVRLVHGMAWLIDDKTTDNIMLEPYDAEERAAIEWFRPMKRGLLAPYAVGTVDQALMSALNVRFGFLRLFGLSSKVLIIDEVHAYDAYMNSILTMLLRWCSSLGIPVILLSATLPQSKRMRLVSAYTGQNNINNFDSAKKTPYPLITLADGPGSLREIPIGGPTSHIQISLYRHYGKLGDPAAIAKLAASISENGGCICVIANTVTSAQKIYSELKKLPIEDTIIKLFHARFRAERRQAIENEVLDMFDKRSLLPENNSDRTIRPSRAILVATQVVEQSLDLDFDEMITEIAPVDLILQRSGRLHRHQRDKRPSGETRRLHILYPASGSLDFGPTKLVYDSYILIRTLFAINKDCICLPDDMRELVEIVYSEKALPVIDDLQWIRKEDIKIAYDKMVAKESKDAGESATYLIRQPDIEEFSLRSMARSCFFKENEGDANSYFYASTRISDYEERQIILLEGDEYASELDLERSPGRAIMAGIMKNLVSLPAYWIEKVYPCDGYNEINASPRWLSGKLILRLKNGQWTGIDENRKKIVIKDDEELGITIEKEDKSGNI